MEKATVKPVRATVVRTGEFMVRGLASTAPAVLSNLNPIKVVKGLP